MSVKEEGREGKFDPNPINTHQSARTHVGWSDILLFVVQQTNSLSGHPFNDFSTLCAQCMVVAFVVIRSRAKLD